MADAGQGKPHRSPPVTPCLTWPELLGLAHTCHPPDTHKVMLPHVTGLETQIKMS